jgi:hypothetical protein
LKHQYSPTFRPSRLSFQVADVAPRGSIAAGRFCRWLAPNHPGEILMPTEFMGRALQRQRDAVQRQMLQELQAIRARLPARDEYGLSCDAAVTARIEQLEEQVRVLAGVVMELYHPVVTQAPRPPRGGCYARGVGGGRKVSEKKPHN